jgi:hypothetical protein
MPSTVRGDVPNAFWGALSRESRYPTASSSFEVGPPLEKETAMAKTEGLAAEDIIRTWPDESREAAQTFIDAHGEPAEASASLLIWDDVGQWKRVVASRTFYEHDFPAPHIDSVRSIIDYRVPADRFTPLAEFDGSVIVERTAGEISARCHDEQANFLALNLAHDIVTGSKSVQEARAYYAKEFLDFRRKKPTPYMEKLHFAPPKATADPDTRMLSDEDLEAAMREGEKRG